MKKLLLAVIILLFAGATHAQIGGILNTAQAASGFNTNSVTQKIMGKLTPSLSLTNTQKPKVTDAVSTYLAGKSKILPLLTSNKAAYTQQQSGLFQNLKTKLQGILIQQQMNKFLGMKSSTGVVSQLFN
jgi:hypothetical protein